MTDERRREDERATLTTADPAARAPWIVSRLRAGDLELASVRLAALAGDPAAAVAFGRGAPRPLPSLDGSDTAGWPVMAWCAAAVGAARLTVPLLGDAAGWGRSMIDDMDAWLRSAARAVRPRRARVSCDDRRPGACGCCGVRVTTAELARTAVALVLTMRGASGRDASRRMREVCQYAATALERDRWERHASIAARDAHWELRRRVVTAETQLGQRLKPLQREVARAVARGRDTGSDLDALRERMEAGRRAIAELSAEAERLAALVPPFPGGSASAAVDQAARRELAEWALRPASRFA